MKPRRRISLKGAQGIALFLNQQQAARQSHEAGASHIAKQIHDTGDERGREDDAHRPRNRSLSNKSLTTSARAVARAFAVSQVSTSILGSLPPISGPEPAATLVQAAMPNSTATTATTVSRASLEPCGHKSNTTAAETAKQYYDNESSAFGAPANSSPEPELSPDHPANPFSPRDTVVDTARFEGTGLDDEAALVSSLASERPVRRYSTGTNPFDSHSNPFEELHLSDDDNAAEASVPLATIGRKRVASMPQLLPVQSSDMLEQRGAAAAHESRYQTWKEKTRARKRVVKENFAINDIALTYQEWKVKTKARKHLVKFARGADMYCFSYADWKDRAWRRRRDCTEHETKVASSPADGRNFSGVELKPKRKGQTYATFLALSSGLNFETSHADGEGETSSDCNSESESKDSRANEHHLRSEVGSNRQSDSESNIESSNKGDSDGSNISSQAHECNVVSGGSNSALVDDTSGSDDADPSKANESLEQFEHSMRDVSPDVADSSPARLQTIQTTVQSPRAPALDQSEEEESQMHEVERLTTVELEEMYAMLGQGEITQEEFDAVIAATNHVDQASHTTNSADHVHQASHTTNSAEILGQEWSRFSALSPVTPALSHDSAADITTAQLLEAEAGWARQQYTREREFQEQLQAQQDTSERLRLERDYAAAEMHDAAARLANAEASQQTTLDAWRLAEAAASEHAEKHKAAVETTRILLENNSALSAEKQALQGAKSALERDCQALRQRVNAHARSFIAQQRQVDELEVEIYDREDELIQQQQEYEDKGEEEKILCERLKMEVEDQRAVSMRLQSSLIQAKGHELAVVRDLMEAKEAADGVAQAAVQAKQCADVQYEAKLAESALQLELSEQRRQQEAKMRVDTERDAARALRSEHNQREILQQELFVMQDQLTKEQKNASAKVREFEARLIQESVRADHTVNELVREQGKHAKDMQINAHDKHRLLVELDQERAKRTRAEMERDAAQERADHHDIVRAEEALKRCNTSVLSAFGIAESEQKCKTPILDTNASISAHESTSIETAAMSAVQSAQEADKYLDYATQAEMEAVESDERNTFADVSNVVDTKMHNATKIVSTSPVSLRTTVTSGMPINLESPLSTPPSRTEQTEANDTPSTSAEQTHTKESISSETSDADRIEPFVVIVLGAPRVGKTSWLHGMRRTPANQSVLQWSGTCAEQRVRAVLWDASSPAILRQADVAGRANDIAEGSSSDCSSCSSKTSSGNTSKTSDNGSDGDCEGSDSDSDLETLAEQQYISPIEGLRRQQLGWQRAHGIIVIYDVGNVKSFEAALDTVQALRDPSNDIGLAVSGGDVSQLQIMFVENKVDMLPPVAVQRAWRRKQKRAAHSPHMIGGRPPPFVPEEAVWQACREHRLLLARTSAMCDKHAATWGGDCIHDAMRALAFKMVRSLNCQQRRYR